MVYQHKIITNHPQKTIHTFGRDIPYIPHAGDTMVFPEGWKAGGWFKITNVEHYVVDKMVVIRVNPI